MKSLVRWILLLAAVTLLSSCVPSPGNPATAPTFSPVEASSPTAIPTFSQTPSAANPQSCKASNISLQAWQEMLPFDTLLLVPQIYQGQISLTLWYIDPTLDQAGVEEENNQPAESAIAALKQLSLRDECLFAFENVAVTVVDSSYRLRFSGSIRTDDLKQISSSDLDGGSGESGGGRILPTQGEMSGAGQTCQWPQVSAGLKETLAEQASSADFVLVREDNGSTLTAYLVMAQPPNEHTLTGLVASIYQASSCLQPSLNGLLLVITLPDFQLVLTGYQPLDPGGSYDAAAFSYTRLDTP